MPLRWSPERAAPEFAVSHATIRASLAQASEHPGPDGLFSTGQLLNALHGSLAQERLGTQRAVRRRVELSNRITEGSVIDKSALMQGLSRIADAMVSRITASELSDEAKSDLLKELSSIPLVLEDVVAQQSKLPRNGSDGKDDGDDNFDDEDEVDSETPNRKVPKQRFRMRPGFRAQKPQTA
jgi:hypothetical protein